MSQFAIIALDKAITLPGCQAAPDTWQINAGGQKWGGYEKDAFSSEDEVALLSRGGAIFTSAEAFALWLKNSEQVFDPSQADDLHYLDTHWRLGFRDYKQAREHMKLVVIARGGFASLTDEEQRIAARWFVLSSAEIDQVLNLEERLVAGKAFDEGSVASRVARFSAAKNLLYNTLNKQDGENVMGMILNYKFREMYCELGQEGTMMTNYKGETDQPGIFDFVMGTSDGKTAFGYTMRELISQALYGYTPEQVVERCIAIIRDGNY